ncbi:MAG: anti-sigma factor family protein [Ktedonobacterales bacterium]
MPELGQVPVRIHRVTTRRRNLHTLQCPLEPELLVAEFAGELPPDVALAVREHIAVCEACGGRSHALRAPYELLASLGNQPVPYVPDLRDSVRARVRRKRLYRGAMRFAGTVGRGGALGIAGLMGIAVVAVFVLVGVLANVNARPLSRSTNGLTHVASAGTGSLFAQTDKLVTVKDRAGRSWQVAEVVVVDELTGVVRRSLPAGKGALQTADAKTRPVAVVVSPDGGTVYELTAADKGGTQALIAINTASGAVQYITPLALPGATALPAQQAADALALSSDGTLAYIGLNSPRPTSGEPRALRVVATTGEIIGTLAPYVTYSIPMPPPPGSLPLSVFPNAAPVLNASQGTFSLGAGGALAVSPDDRWLFDVLLLKMPNGGSYAVVRRISTLTGMTTQELALSGDFHLARLALAGTAPDARLVLAQGSPEAQVFLLDPSATGPTQITFVPLGGPPSPLNDIFSGTLTLGVTSDDTAVYVAQNVVSGDGSIEGHDLWLLSLADGTLLAHRLDNDAATAAAGTGSASSAFLLRGGEVLFAAAGLSGNPAPWLSLSDGHPVVALLGTSA